ncbi:NFACT family protein [Nanoarchaeota archaeon]
MRNELSALELNNLVKEFQILKDAKIDQIYQSDKKDLSLQFYISGKGKKILRVLPKFIFLASKRPESKQLGFCQLLRKKLSNAFLREIEQIGFERILKLSFETKTERFELFIELFDSGNVILTKDNIIIDAVEKKKWKDRVILHKKEYVYPEKEFNLLKLTNKELEKVLKETKQESLVKSLAIDLGLGGVLAEKLCEISKNSKNIKPSETKADSLFKAIGELKKTKFKDLNKELDEFFSKQIVESKKEEQTKVKTEKIGKVETIIKIQEKNLKKIEKDVQENQKKAELIYEKYQAVDEILKELKKARTKYSWKEIKAKLKDHKVIKEINEKEGMIQIEI